ncbi:MAG TPA: hypothetical protein VHR86_04300, partial [Armatimonadota bacterium]|nr:hypothetical protein [Armatimonadota bacterium]
DFEDRMHVNAADVTRVLGQEVSAAAMSQGLTAYGLGVTAQDGCLEIALPPYRRDYMHSVDAVEDYLISVGYNSFEPIMPSEFTVGNLCPIEQLSDHVRDLITGLGFVEIMTNVLTARPDCTTRLGLPDEPVVAIGNVMSELYAVLRNSLVPSMLRMESISSRATYPHRVFELGEVQVPDPSAAEKSRTEVRLAAFLGHAGASFSEAHSYLDALFFYLDREYELAPVERGTFIAGRAGEIRVNGRSVGYIGEVDPAVLEQWSITVPCALFELTLDNLLYEIKQ